LDTKGDWQNTFVGTASQRVSVVKASLDLKAGNPATLEAGEHLNLDTGRKALLVGFVSRFHIAPSGSRYAERRSSRGTGDCDRLGTARRESKVSEVTAVSAPALTTIRSTLNGFPFLTTAMVADVFRTASTLVRVIERKVRRIKRLHAPFPQG
jgi:hypothetical protein